MDQDQARTAAGADDSQVVSDHIRRAVAGEEAALTWLVDWLSPLMLAWAKLQLRPGMQSQLTAEDLVQDVWIRILPELRRLAPHPTIGRWTPGLFGLVKRILRNRVIDVRRQATRCRLQYRSGDAMPAMSLHADSSSGPISKVLRGERQRLVQTALDRLTHRERALYVKRLFEDASIDELAREFSMTSVAVIKARQRVRQRLTGILAPEVLDQLEGM